MPKWIFGAAAVLALLSCLGAPIAYFRGALSEPSFQSVFALGSVAWFVTATLYVSRK